MLRFALGIAIVSAIYVHSPVRPQGGLTDDLSRWTQRARDEAATSVAKSGLARDLAAEAAKDVAKELVAGRRAAAPAPPPKPLHSPAG